ncbi:hypothetical protein F4677DRAFT_144715 [Hypoxylon crocopeplum]|nr:hypothetical protein F4677DRAFT_144715 [Hypoxylon crocopeplum]
MVVRMIPFSPGSQYIPPPPLLRGSYPWRFCHRHRHIADQYGPFFLDTPLKTIYLLSHDNEDAHRPPPCVIGSLQELTCMGDMVGGPVFVFQLRSPYYRAEDILRRKRDLLACVEDVLDTWGPGEMIADGHNRNSLVSVSVGGGYIYVSEGGQPYCAHWSRQPFPDNEFQKRKYRRFDQATEFTIGTTVMEISHCLANSRKQLENAVTMSEELGTYPSYWEVAERQLGIGFQAGQTGVGIFQFNQTWAKMAGTTKKSAILYQRAIYIADLEGLFAVQVSVCTGIARRVRLRDLLADLLPAYIAGLVTKPPLWKSLQDDFDILRALREDDLGHWLERLGHDHQLAFESLAFAILYLLRDTGVDRKGQNFVVACIQVNLPFRCFKVPCKGDSESYWARMLADSEDNATFAYMTTQCLETSHIKCTGPSAAWTNSTALLRTAVSCYEEKMPVGSSLAAGASSLWSLKHSEAYLIGPPDSSLFVQVDRPDVTAEPRLLASLSTIPHEYLYRLSRRWKTRKPKRLREKRFFERSAENVIVLVNHAKASRA